MFSRLFPTFEKPIERPRYLNVEPAHRDFSGVATVLVLAATCGVALALWEPSIRTTPFATASVQPAGEAPKVAAAPQPATQAMAQQTTAAAEVEEDEPAPTVKTSTLCAQRASARRDCAQVRAIRDARLTAPDPAPVPAAKAEARPHAKPAPVVPAASPATSAASEPAPAPVKTVATERPETAAPKPAPVAEAPAAASAQEAPAAKPQRTAKKSKPRVQEEAPVERLVRVYDQVLPDGRRVPVYRRANGRYEVGSIVDGEYRSSGRRADMYGPRYFGLQ